MKAKLRNKRIILGVTGGIAAYKAAELIRCLIREGAGVSVVMTESATKFISPLTLRVLSKNRVYCSLFENVEPLYIAPSDMEAGSVSSNSLKEIVKEPEHIGLAENCDLLLIAPATANIIGKIAHGLADDLLSTIALAVRSPIVVAPAMNEAMYENRVFKNNMKLMADRDVKFVEPDRGELASGKIGKGRLADIESIVDEVERVLLSQDKRDFLGKTIVVSAGPTREPIDPIRFLSNPSTGRMGYALAKASKERGARVILVSGPTHIASPENVKFIGVETALEMRKAVLESAKKADIVAMTAAVANFRPVKKAGKKISKAKGALKLELAQNPDILAELGREKGKRVLIGFSVETDNHIRRAKEKLREKNLDFIVANDPSQNGAGFAVETNIVEIIDRGGSVKKLPRMHKEEIAHIILDKVAGLLKKTGVSI